ncbi:hypothetical protein LC55x_3462 [Lysobacter capsici]|nr:hypothetical protein LC55x_3462 [Lysobacter capsici]
MRSGRIPREDADATSACRSRVMARIRTSTRLRRGSRRCRLRFALRRIPCRRPVVDRMDAFRTRTPVAVEPTVARRAIPAASRALATDIASRLSDSLRRFVTGRRSA